MGLVSPGGLRSARGELVSAGFFFTWRSSDTGWQAWKLESLRKVLKKVGQEACVKLFPRLVSKGLGRDVVIAAELLLATALRANITSSSSSSS